jgi:hypothetical protein
VAALWALQLFRRDAFSRIARWAYRGAFVYLALACSYLTYVQYRIWNAKAFTRILIPPQGTGYFAQYVLFKFWAPYLVSAAVSLLVLWAASRSNRKGGERFLYADETYAIALALLIAGFPGIVLYGLLFFVVFLAVLAACAAFLGAKYRLSPYYLWLPVAVCVILAQEFMLKDMPWWQLLRF